VILDVAQEIEAGLIVMASHGRTGLSRLLLAASPSRFCAGQPVRY